MKHNALSRFDPERSPLVTRDLITGAHLFGWEVVGDDDFSFSVRDAQGLTLTLTQVWRVGLVLEQDATEPQHEPQSVAITESLWWAENLLAALIASKPEAGDAEQSTAAFPGVEATIPEHSLLRKLDPAELSASALEQWFSVPTNPVQTGDEMPSDTLWTKYFAVLDAGFVREWPSGLMRRIKVDGRDLTDDSVWSSHQRWDFTTFFIDSQLGRNDLEVPVIEVDKAEADLIREGLWVRPRGGPFSTAGQNWLAAHPEDRAAKYLGVTPPVYDLAGRLVTPMGPLAGDPTGSPVP